MSFNLRLRRLRQKRGLTWYALGKLSGVPKQVLSRLEQPNSNPTLATLRKLARVFGVSLDELAGNGGPEEKKTKHAPRKKK
jgi:transcriptional regulator with XRE-family HTH domain